MKKALLSFTALATLFASCSSEDLGADPNNPVEEGIPTYATFQLTTNTAGPLSRATLPDDTGEPATGTVSDAVILIFDSEGGQKLTNKITIESGNKKTVSLKSGTKRIFTLCNVSDGLSTDSPLEEMINNLSEGVTSLSDYYKLMTNPFLSGNAAGLGDEWASIAKASKLFMSNGASAQSKRVVLPGVTSDDAGNVANENYFKISVKRAVAKAKLKLKDASVRTTLDGVTLGDMSYGTRNINRSTFLSQQFLSDNTLDNDYEATPTPVPVPTRSFAPYYYQFTTGGSPVTDFNKYYYDHGFDVELDTDVKPATYISENSNDKQMTGNSTYWGIKSKINAIPKEKIVASFTRISPPTDNLKGRTYNIMASTEDYTRTAGNTDDIYYVRITPGTEFVNLIGGARIFLPAKKDIAFEALYLALEVMGVIGTPDNNNTSINNGIFPSNTIPSQCVAGGELYYANAEALQGAFTTGEPTVTDPYKKAAIQKISARLSLLKFASSLSDLFGYYKAGDCYHRLNIKETTDNGTNHIVRRNYSYSGTVTAFKSIGEPTEEDLDKNPGEEVDEALTHITAEIEVQAWREREIEGEV